MFPAADVGSRRMRRGVVLLVLLLDEVGSKAWLCLRCGHRGTLMREWGRGGMFRGLLSDSKLSCPLWRAARARTSVIVRVKEINLAS